MNRTKLIVLAAAGLVCMSALVACSDDKKSNGKESGTDTSATTGTVPAETAIPRYDYMDAEVAPNVTIDKSAYTDLTLTISDSLKITDETVQNHIKAVLFTKREAVNGTNQLKDAPLSLGDDAFIYYKGFVDGKEFEGGSNWDDSSPYQLGLGSGSFIPGFEEGLVGVIPNETSKENPFELKVTFPEEYTEELAGKEATFHVVVMYGVQHKIPEYTWDFVKNTLKYELSLKESFYASDRAKLDEYEAYVREQLIAENADYVENAKLSALWDHMLENATCKNLPEDELSYYYNSYVAEIEYYFEYYSAYGGEEFTKLYPKFDDFAPIYIGLEKGGDWKAEINAQAERMVKKDMISHAVAEIEGIESVTDKEYQEEIQYWVDSYNGYMSASDVVSSMGEVALRESAFNAKMTEWFFDRITFTYEDGTPLDEVTEETPAESEAESEEESEEESEAATESAEAAAE